MKPTAVTATITDHQTAERMTLGCLEVLAGAVHSAAVVESASADGLDTELMWRLHGAAGLTEDVFLAVKFGSPLVYAAGMRALQDLQDLPVVAAFVDAAAQMEAAS